MQKLPYLPIVILFLTLMVISSGCLEPSIPLEDDATPYIVNFTFVKPSSTTFSKNQYIPIVIQQHLNPSVQGLLR